METWGLMTNNLSIARTWTEFVAARPELKCGELFLQQFKAGEITRLCDCGCNSYEIKLPHGAATTASLIPSGEHGGCVFQLEFQTEEWGKTVSFSIFVDNNGNLSGLDVDYCGNSFPMPEKPRLSGPPFHVYGTLAREVQPSSQPDAARNAAQRC